jgi:hypothetical protein
LNKNETLGDSKSKNQNGNTEKINNLNIDGNLISNHQGIAHAFNKYFLTIAKSINTTQNDQTSHNSDNNNPLHHLMQCLKNPFPNIHLKSTSTKQVKKLIKPLKPKTLSGYDEISTELLNISYPFISSPLTHICNKSLS